MKKRVITKSLPTGWIEENLEVTWRTFNLLLAKVSLDNQIGHRCVVDIKLDHKNATENWIAYKEIYPPIIEKQNIIDPCERSVYQLLEQYSATEKLKKLMQLYSKKFLALVFRSS